MPIVDAARPTLVLVHGSWHGSWCWYKLLPALAAEGWVTRTVDLPSTSRLTGMYHDADTVRACLASIDGPVMLVGHSYGGIPVTEAAADADNVVHLVYLASFPLMEGESLCSVAGMGETAGWLPPIDDPHKTLYGDLSPDEADWAVAHLLPQTGRSFADKVTEAGWRTIASTYVLCEKDEALPPAFQEQMAARTTALVRLDSDHSPFLSQPATLAKVLAAVASAAPTGQTRLSP